MGREYLSRQRIEDAFQLVSRGMKSSRPLNELETLYGLILSFRGDYEESTPYLKKGLNQEEDKFNCLFALGMSNYNLQNLSESEDYLKQALEIEYRPQTLLYYAHALREQSNFDGAIEQYKRLLELDSNQPDAYYFMGLIYHKQEKFDKAFESVKHAVDLDQNNYLYQSSAAVYLWDQHKHQEAIPYFQSAIRLQPKNEKYYFLLATCYEKLEMNESLEETIKKLDSLGYTIFKNDEGELVMSSNQDIVVFPYVYPGYPFKAH